MAKEMGWQTVLVGPERDGAKEGAGARTVVGADVQVDTVHELRDVFPEIFSAGGGGEEKSGVGGGAEGGGRAAGVETREGGGEGGQRRIVVGQATFKNCHRRLVAERHPEAFLWCVEAEESVRRERICLRDTAAAAAAVTKAAAAEGAAAVTVATESKKEAERGGEGGKEGVGVLAAGSQAADLDWDDRHRANWEEPEWQGKDVTEGRGRVLDNSSDDADVMERRVRAVLLSCADG